MKYDLKFQHLLNVQLDRDFTLSLIKIIALRSPYLSRKMKFLHDLVPFAQFKKRGKLPQRSVTFSKDAG